MSRGVAALLAVVVLAAGVFVKIGTERRTDVVDTIGIYPEVPVVGLSLGDVACETPLQLQPEAAAVTFNTSSSNRPAGPLEVTVEAEQGGTTFVRRRIPFGFTDGKRVVSLRGAPTDRLVRICIRSLSRQRVRLWGVIPRARRDETVQGLLEGRYTTSSVQLEVNGEKWDSDVALEFVADDERMLLDLFSRAPERMGVWLPAPLGAWTLWVLFWALALGGAAALALAVRDAERPDE